MVRADETPLSGALSATDTASPDTPLRYPAAPPRLAGVARGPSGPPVRPAAAPSRETLHLITGRGRA